MTAEDLKEIEGVGGKVQNEFEVTWIYPFDPPWSWSSVDFDRLSLRDNLKKEILQGLPFLASLRDRSKEFLESIRRNPKDFLLLFNHLGDTARQVELSRFVLEQDIVPLGETESPLEPLLRMIVDPREVGIVGEKSGETPYEPPPKIEAIVDIEVEPMLPPVQKPPEKTDRKNKAERVAPKAKILISPESMITLILVFVHHHAGIGEKLAQRWNGALSERFQTLANGEMRSMRRL